MLDDKDTFRAAQIFTWITPATLAGWEWGLAVGLLTFGAQMFAAPPITKMYELWKVRNNDFDIGDIRRFNLMANVLCGTGFAFMARALTERAASGG